MSSRVWWVDQPRVGGWIKRTNKKNRHKKYILGKKTYTKYEEAVKAGFVDNPPGINSIGSFFTRSTPGSTTKVTGSTNSSPTTQTTDPDATSTNQPDATPRNHGGRREGAGRSRNADCSTCKRSREDRRGHYEKGGLELMITLKEIGVLKRKRLDLQSISLYIFGGKLR